jgi:hypothetical protein
MMYLDGLTVLTEFLRFLPAMTEMEEVIAVLPHFFL